MANLYVYEQGTTLDYKNENFIVKTLKEKIIPAEKLEKLERVIVFGDRNIKFIVYKNF